MSGKGKHPGCWWKSQSERELRRRCVYNIIMDLGETGWGDVDWIVLPQ
jgi:hypothetical protein